jgi:pyridoxine kinase
MCILSIQSAVVAGHVGNSASTFFLQRLGFPVWPVNTVMFSNHPAHGSHTGHVTPAEDLQALIDGLDQRGLLARCTAILSGYLGDARTGPIVLDAVRRVRAQNADAVYLCDPVIGDKGQIYVADGIADFFAAEGIAAADVITPNTFEAAYLTGIAIQTPADALAAADQLHAGRPRIVVISGIETEDGIMTICTAGDSAWQVTYPTIDAPGYGSGDLFAGLLLGRLLRRADPKTALEHAAAATHTAVRLAAASGSADLPLIKEQDAILNPGTIQPAIRLR